MFRRAAFLFALLVPGALFSSCETRAAEGELVVFAAASLRDVATELAERFEEREGIRVAFNFAGSNTLAQQILAAPKADAFLSADTEWIEALERQGRLVPGSRRDFLGNRLVVVAREDSRVTIDSALSLLAHPARIAIADPQGVPAGRYARSWLDGAPLEEAIATSDTELPLRRELEKRLLPTSDVRAALALVRSDPEIVGIVYASDVATVQDVRVLFEPKVDEQPDIVYGAALIARDVPAPHARAFLDFLFEPEIHEIYTACGFAPPLHPSETHPR